jgi:hypothetical protein
MPRPPAKQPQFDREALRELARCFARAAVDELIAGQRKQTKPDRTDQSDIGAAHKQEVS